LRHPFFFNALLLGRFAFPPNSCPRPFQRGPFFVIFSTHPPPFPPPQFSFSLRPRYFFLFKQIPLFATPLSPPLDARSPPAKNGFFGDHPLFFLSPSPHHSFPPFLAVPFEVIPPFPPFLFKVLASLWEVFTRVSFPLNSGPFSSYPPPPMGELPYTSFSVSFPLKFPKAPLLLQVERRASVFLCTLSKSSKPLPPFLRRIDSGIFPLSRSFERRTTPFRTHSSLQASG